MRTEIRRKVEQKREQILMYNDKMIILGHFDIINIILQHTVIHQNKAIKGKESTKDTYSELNILNVKKDDKHYHHDKGGSRTRCKGQLTRHQNMGKVDGAEYGKLNFQ